MKKKGLTVRSLLNKESFDIEAEASKRSYYTPVKKKNLLEPLPIRKDIKKRMNKRLKMDGLKMLKKLDEESIRVAFFDPAIYYQANPMNIADPMKLAYIHPMNSTLMYEPINDGNTIDAMRKSVLSQFIRAYYRILVPSGFLFMWIDEMRMFHGIKTFLWDTEFIRRNFITWDVGEVQVKRTDYKESQEIFKDMSNLLILQKPPNKTEGHWFDGWFLDIYVSKTKVASKWKKPIDLQAKLIKASTLKSDLVVDAAAGSFSVFKACQKAGRNFLGCNI